MECTNCISMYLHISLKRLPKNIFTPIVLVHVKYFLNNTINNCSCSMIQLIRAITIHVCKRRINNYVHIKYHFPNKVIINFPKTCLSYDLFHLNTFLEINTFLILFFLFLYFVLILHFLIAYSIMKSQAV